MLRFTNKTINSNPFVVLRYGAPVIALSVRETNSLIILATWPEIKCMLIIEVTHDIGWA